MRKKALVTLLVMGMAVANIFAQKEKHMEIAFQAGGGTSWIVNQMNYGLFEMEYEYYWNYGFNLQFGYNFNEYIGLFTEVEMARGGQKYYDNWSYPNYNIKRSDAIERKVSMNYLNVPLLFKYTYGDTKARFRMYLGPQLRFLQSAEQDYTINGAPLEGRIELENNIGEPFDPAQKDIKDRFESMDVAVLLDIGADIFLIEEVMYLSAALRGHYSLNDLNVEAFQIKNREGVYAPSHNASLMVYVGIHYIIGSGR